VGLVFWKKPKSSSHEFSEKVLKRISMIATPDLTNWVDQALSETSRCMSSYESSKDPVHIEDALVGAEAIYALVSELHKRSVV
jgi:hypothetical protein